MVYIEVHKTKSQFLLRHMHLERMGDVLFTALKLTWSGCHVVEGMHNSVKCVFC